MKLIIQSVKKAKVEIYEDEQYTSLKKEEKIGRGILIYFGVGKDDESREDRKIAIEKFSHKLTTLKLLDSLNGKIETPLSEFGNQILLISNFTLFGRYKNGTKIDFSQSGNYLFSKKVYEMLILKLQEEGFNVKSGDFGADMLVSSINSGPINYIFEI